MAFTTEQERVLVSLADALLAASGQSIVGTKVRPASDGDLSGEHGDPTVKFTPRRFKDGDYKGRRMSECPSDFLEVYAEALEYSGNNPKPGKEKYAKYDLLDSARALGHAARNRSGAKPAPAPAQDTGGADWDGQGADGSVDDVPF